MIRLLPTEAWEYSSFDLLRGLRSGLTQERTRQGVPLPGLGMGIPIRSARAAVIIALKALNLGQGAKIGVPLYCCPVVFKAIKTADCYPIFLDIDPATFCLSPEDVSAKSAGLDALIAVHMFGNLCDMPKVINAMNGKPVIEDCAQSLGSSIEGRPSGSFGRASFFSFRSGKYLSAGEGGALFSDNAGLNARISGLVSGLPRPTRAQELKHVLLTYVRSKLRGRALWGPVGSRVWRTYNRRVEFADKSPISVGGIYASDLATVRQRMMRLDSMIARQRSNASSYERRLRVGPSLICHQRAGTAYNRFMFPITFPTAEHRDLVSHYLTMHGIGTAKPYEDVIEGAARHYGYEGDCPAAERALKRTLVIPNQYMLGPGDIERIASKVNAGWASTMIRT